MVFAGARDRCFPDAGLTVPHATMKISGGVDENRTPALNEAGLSYSQLIRFVPDRGGLTLAQKLGGWTKFFPSTIQAIVRALWPWEDTNGITYLAVGAEALANKQAQLSVISGGNQVDITPRSIVDNVTVNASTTVGSNVVTIADAVTAVDRYYSVYISTHIAVGGIVLYGFYRCQQLSGTTYNVLAANILGNPFLATATVANGGDVANFTTTISSPEVTVTLANHGFQVGDVFPIEMPVTVGGLTLYSNYRVQSVVNANNFTIFAKFNATASTSGFINNGKANFTYFVGVGSATSGTGYGIGGYGSGGYGTGTNIIATTGTPIYATDWTLDNWGQILLASPVASNYIEFTVTNATGSGTAVTLTFSGNYTIPVGATITVQGVSPTGYNGTFYVTSATSTTVVFASATVAAFVSSGTIRYYVAAFSPIFQWDPLSGSAIAVVIPEGPAVNDGFFVAMPQRQIVAWGSSFTGIKDPLLVRWCDIENFGAWVGTVVNQAGSYRIPKGSRVVGGIQGPQQGLLWTDLGLWAMQYISQPFVYGFNELGTGCGLIARKAAISMNGLIYWMGQSQFYKLAGQGVEPIFCPIWDVIFQDLDRDNLTKIRIAPNSRFGEVAWFYPTLSAGEVNAYVKNNVSLQMWDYGTLSRTAWINESVLGPPIGADATKYLYQHETSTDADGAPLSAGFQTGYFAMQDADVMTFVDEVWPDMKWGYFDGVQSATVNLTFYGTDFPGQAPTVYGPYALTQSTKWINPRIRNRLLSIKIDSNDTGSFWRIGAMRYRYQGAGRYS